MYLNVKDSAFFQKASQILIDVIKSDNGNLMAALSFASVLGLKNRVTSAGN